MPCMCRKTVFGYLKGPRGMTSIFVFNFVNEVVHLRDHGLFFLPFLILNIFYQRFYESSENLNKLFVYLKDG